MTTNQNTINDVSTLLKVPNKTLNVLVSKLNLCIGSAIHDALLNKESTVLLNVGIGQLSINLADMQCKFLPSKDLKSTIKRCIDEKVDPLEFEIETAVIAKLINTCDEEI